MGSAARPEIFFATGQLGEPGQVEMATHSSTLAWTEDLVGYSPWDHKELDMTV